MGSPVRTAALDFSQWADRIRAQSPSFTVIFEEDVDSHPFCSTACIASCCGVLGAIDRDSLGRECCDELVRLNVYHKLGEGSRATWDVASQVLAQRVGTQAQDPAWLQQDLSASMSSVSERLRRACCSSEVAILMLRLAVRAACLGSSWFGPWDNVQALHQLIRANAWSSLLHALESLATTFGRNLAKQYNALNIVSDILHIFYCLSEWHTNKTFTATGVGKASGMPQVILEVVFVVHKHAAYLPPLHRQQATYRDTALLMVPSLLILAIKASKLPTDKSPVYQFIHDFKEIRALLAESLATFDAGRLPGDLGDTPAMVDTGCICRASSLLIFIDLVKNHHTWSSSNLRMPWERFCEEVPLQTAWSLLDRWLLSSGDARYPSPGKRSAHTMASAVHLLRMVSCCKGSSRFLRRSGLVLRCVHMLRQLLAGPLAQAAPGGQELWRLPAEAIGWGGGYMLNALMDGLTVIADFLGQPWRPYELPVDEPYATGFPSYAVGTRRSALYEEESGRKTWARYDNRVEAVLDMGAAGVLEGLLRYSARSPRPPGRHVYEAQAALLAHTMLHHPRAWPKQETALGLLITLRKFLQAKWMRLPWRPDNPCLAMLPMALLTAIVRKEALLPEHTAAFAATQLLPVIQAATDRHLAVAPRHCYHPDLCKEFLMMCSYLATSSAWPVLLGHRDLITLAADMVLVTFSKGFPAYLRMLPMLDVACIYAAACDVAIADLAFWAADSPATLGMMASLSWVGKRAETEFAKSSEGEGLNALMDLQISRLVASRGIRALPPLEGFMSRWEGLQGTVPDWRRIPFWRIGGYAPAWEAFTEKEMELPTSQNIERTVRRDEAAVTRDPQTGRPVPTAGEKAASELLQARSLLLAGQAGLCCNPRCTGMSGRHERSLRTLRCGGGCQHGRFCSRACQKQAWPVHRSACRRSSNSV